MPPDLLRVEEVTEDPDLPVLPLDVGVTRWQTGPLDGAVELPPHLTRFTHREEGLIKRVEVMLAA